MRKLIIYDTTLRDGEQAPGFGMNPDEKFRICDLLIEAGIDVIEAGFPASSPGEFEAVHNISSIRSNSIISALARAIPEDINIAAEALYRKDKRRINIIMSTSDIHLKYQLRITRKEAVAKSKKAIEFAGEFVNDVQFTAMDATRSDLNFLCEIFNAAIDSGATTLNIADTTGYAVPDEFNIMIKRIKDKVKFTNDIKLSVHCHNDLGLALANTLAAIETGIDQVECTVSGIGERAGNASIGNLIDIIRIKSDKLGVLTGIDKKKYYQAVSLLMSITGNS